MLGGLLLIGAVWGAIFGVSSPSTHCAESRDLNRSSNRALVAERYDVVVTAEAEARANR